MPIINKDGYTLTKDLLPQELAYKVQDGSVTADKLNDGAVITSKLHDGAVITSKLHDGAVTDDKCYSGFALVPRGGIIMWYGAIVNIPTGWAICDGTNGTPDLRNRFVVGAGSTYSVAATGGSANAIVVSHNHSITDSGHAHNVSSNAVRISINDVSSGVLWGGEGGSGNKGYAEVSQTGISVNTTGSAGTNANLPPYYALAYIMRIL